MYVCAPRTRATSLSPRHIHGLPSDALRAQEGLSWLLDGPARRDVDATRGPSAVEFFDGFPVIEVHGEVAIIVLEQALCNGQLIREPKAPCFPAPAFFRNPEVTLNRFRFSMNGIKPLQQLGWLDYDEVGAAASEMSFRPLMADPLTSTPPGSVDPCERRSPSKIDPLPGTPDF